MIITTNLLNNIETAITTPSNEIQGVFYVNLNNNNELSLTYNQIKTQILNEKLGLLKLQTETDYAIYLIIECNYSSDLYTVKIMGSNETVFFRSNSPDGVLVLEMED